MYHSMQNFVSAVLSKTSKRRLGLGQVSKLGELANVDFSHSCCMPKNGVSVQRLVVLLSDPVAGSGAHSLVQSPSDDLSRNCHQWRAVAFFLDAQWLASLGLRFVSTSEREALNCGERKAQRAAAGLREALPVGNTGITSLLELASV